ncbi:MAG: anti-sigma factor family protein [bacterium]
MHDDPIDPRKEKLIAFLYGELPDAEAREIEQMLANDLDLRGEFEELREIKGFLGEWDVEEKEPSFVLVGTAAAGASRGRGANVFEGPAFDAGRRGVFARVAASRAWWGLAAAACLLLVAGASGLRVQRLDGGVAFRFGEPPSSGLSSGVATDVALSTESGLESGLTAFDNVASRSGSDNLLADSRPNPAGELVTASNQIVAPVSGAAPAGGQTPYMTRQEFESYSEGMSKMFIALLKDYGASRDAKLAEAMQAMSEGFTDQQFKDYQELRKRIEAIHVGLAGEGVAGDARLHEVLDENGAGVSLEPRGTSSPRTEEKQQ